MDHLNTALRGLPVAIRRDFPAFAAEHDRAVQAELRHIRTDLKLRRSVAVRAAYAFGDWPPAP